MIVKLIHVMSMYLCVVLLIITLFKCKRILKRSICRSKNKVYNGLFRKWTVFVIGTAVICFVFSNFLFYDTLVSKKYI